MDDNNKNQMTGSMLLNVADSPVKQTTPVSPPQPEPSRFDRRVDNTSTASDDSNSSGFGPPAALLRWQRRRPKSEYSDSGGGGGSFGNSFATSQEKNKRLSSTLPFKSENLFSFDANKYSKDDGDVDRVTRDYVETVSTSKPVESKPSSSYQFNDSSKMEEWEEKQEKQRQVGGVCDVWNVGDALWGIGNGPGYCVPDK